MRFSSVFAVLVAIIGIAFVGPPASIAHGQTVLLPTLRVFSIQGSVRVPDGGSMVMGGIRSHSEGAVTRGVPLLSNVPGANRLFKNRAIGRETSSTNSVVTADIIILEELEQEVLAEAERRRIAAGGVNAAVRQKAAFLSLHVGKTGQGTSQHSRHGKRR